MLSAQRMNDIRALTTAARALGVTLPADLTAQAAHLAELTVEQNVSLNPSVVAGELAGHLGDRAAMAKARKTAAIDLATADAQVRIGANIGDHAARLLYGRVRGAREPIAASFGEALAPHLDTLTATAPRLPWAFSADMADTLDAPTYTGWTKARDAAAAIDTVSRALGFLYPSARGDFLDIPAFAALRWISPPAKFRNIHHAHLRKRPRRDAARWQRPRHHRTTTRLHTLRLCRRRWDVRLGRPRRSRAARRSHHRRRKPRHRRPQRPPHDRVVVTVDDGVPAARDAPWPPGAGGPRRLSSPPHGRGNIPPRP